MRRGSLLRRAIEALALAVSLAFAQPTSAPPKRLTFAILEDYDKGDDFSEVERDFELMRELGIATWRGSIGWDDFEPRRGVYEFAWLHQFATRAAARGITLRPYIAYTPEWAAGGDDRDGQAWNQPPADLRTWRAFVSALARELRHHPNVRSIEIYNEENVKQWWEGSGEAYAATLRTASAAVRGTARFEILMGGLVFPDVEWMEDLCRDSRTARAFDVLPLHAYPETWTPENVTVENYLGSSFRGSFLAAADRVCGRKRIWINETGYATTPGRTERDQAAWWARAIATFAAEPRVEHVGVYEIKDLHPDKDAIGDAPNYHLGLTYVDRTKKLAFSTVKLLNRLLAADRITTADGEIRVTPGGAAPRGERHHHLFVRGDGSRVLIVWNRTEDETVRIQVGVPPHAVSEFALDGSERRVERNDGLEVTLSRGIPRIFHWQF